MPEKQLKEWGKAIVFAAFIASIMYFICWPVRVEGISMEQSFFTGDKLFICRIYPRIAKLNRGDVVICKNSGGEQEKTILKRIIGLPGEHIEIKNNIVYINGAALDENYIGETKTHGNTDITLGSNEYFLMGDNRAPSKDSRTLGPFNKNDILGIAFLKWYPFNKMTLILNPF